MSCQLLQQFLGSPLQLPNYVQLRNHGDRNHQGTIILTTHLQYTTDPGHNKTFLWRMLLRIAATNLLGILESKWISTTLHPNNFRYSKITSRKSLPRRCIGWLVLTRSPWRSNYPCTEKYRFQENFHHGH